MSVLEKRATFSRVNILTLWPQTADDLMGFGAKLFYPRFTNHGDLLHLGTREIQCARAAHSRRCAFRRRPASHALSCHPALSPRRLPSDSRAARACAEAGLAARSMRNTARCAPAIVQTSALRSCCFTKAAKALPTRRMRSQANVATVQPDCSKRP